MLTFLLKYFFTCFNSLYICNKIILSKPKKNFCNIIFVMIGFGMALLTSLFKNHESSFRIILIFTLCHFFVCVYYNVNFYSSFITVTLSLGLCLVLYTLSTSIVCLITLLFYRSAEKLPYALFPIPEGILLTISVYYLINNKRFRNGIVTLIHGKKYFITTLIALLFVLYVAITSTKTTTIVSIRTIVIILFIFLSIFLLFYWRHRITQTYREKLRQANEKSMLDEINEHKATIEKLKADNKRLASIVHADNKLVPAMLTAVTSHLENYDHLSMEELATRGREMSEQLRSMAKDRQGILDSQHNETAALPKSGLHTVDGMLSFMKAHAEENHIVYKVTFADTIKDTALNALSEEDLLRLLGDLIDNAIIAVNHSEKEKAILIHLGILQDKFLVEISDSGIPFSIETYQRFGNEQYTTHKDSGGSGIGLIDIWKIKKKYKASLHIYEFPEDHGNYTKKISFVFDRKNHFLLQTNRYKEITRELTRGDLYVFPYQSE